MKKHSNRGHAFLSASGASRWMNCTPSPSLESQFENETSQFAQEGTLAHEFADLALQKATGKMNARDYNKETKKHRGNELYTDEMEGQVEKYTTYVLEEFGAAKKKTVDAVNLIEAKVDLTDFIDEGYGTCDDIIIADGTMEVIDLKYGKGVRVSAVDNSQLKLYGLGALKAYEMLYDIVTVKLTIVQPRLDSISTWEIPAADLLAWAEKEVKPKAQMAFKGEGLQKAGEWCRWCKAKARCATLAAKNVELAKHDFADPHLLTDAQLMEVYKQGPLLSIWVDAVGTYVLKQALLGKKWPGYKLVEGGARRKWLDAQKVIKALQKEGFKDLQILKSDIKGIGDIEKLLGKVKFRDVLSDLVMKPPGKPNLVPESDKRPEMKSINQAKNDFK